MINHEYRCQKCDYLFDDLMSPVVDIVCCPICGGETVWIMDNNYNRVSERTSKKRSDTHPKFHRIPSLLEGSLES